MALSKDLEFRLDHAVTDDKIGDEIAARVEVTSTPATANAAQAILDILEESRNAAITERLTVGLAGDGSQGRELAKKINGMVAVLKAKANGNEVNAVAAQFEGQVAGMATDVTIDADVAGAAGNITLANDYVASVAADAEIVLSGANVALASVAAGALRNGETFDLEVEAPAANPTDTVLVDFTGTADAIVCTVTPNDGTNNGTTAVDLTTAELVELINTGLVVGKNITITDLSNLRELQTASGGDAAVLADGGEGDSVSATFANGADATGSDIDTIIAAHNAAAAANEQVTLSAGDGSQVPQADITLTGGAAAQDTDIAGAKSAMGSELMSEDARFHLEHALGSKAAADEFKASYDAMVAAIQAIS